MRDRRSAWLFVAALSAMLGIALAPLVLQTPPAHGTGYAACTELVANGGFETTEPPGSGWDLVAVPPLDPITLLIDPFFPHSGSLGAYLGGRDDADDRISQQVALPAGAEGLQLSFWWARMTEEHGAAVDYLYASLYEQDGTTLIADLLTASNADGSDNWVWNSVTVDLLPYAGQTVILRFRATTDVNLPTSFFVDDVSILDGVNCPTVTPELTPTPTATSTPTPDLVSTPTPTSTATNTPVRVPVYLPMIIARNQVSPRNLVSSDGLEQP